MPNPIEMVKRVPWEVWVGLLLTIVVAWIATRQAVSAGQAQAESQTLDGAQVAEPLPQEPIVDAISQQSASQNAALGGLADSFGKTQGELATSQQAILGQLADANAAYASGLAQVRSGSPLAQPSGAWGTPAGELGTLLGTHNQNAAGSSAQVSATTQAEGGRQAPQPAPSGDIGMHSATDTSGNTYTINKAYGDMTDQEKDDANRFAHGYSG
jgi:hypothetical protein